MYDQRGVHCLLVVVKASFEVVRGRVVPTSEPAEIRAADEYSDPGNGSTGLVAHGDLSEPKPLLDVIVRGFALPPKPAIFHDVAVRFRQRTVPLRVHGQRFFEPDVVGLKIGRAVAFEEQAITYDIAYGGVSADLSEVEFRNPAGRGVATTGKELDGASAPQIEHPDRPHRRPSDKHEPVGYGPIPPHWAPRKDYYGAMADARYLEMIGPLVPENFDPRFHQQAHPTLQFVGHLQTGEELVTLGMTRGELFRFQVPAMQVRVRSIYDQRSVAIDCPVDTLFVEPHRGRLELTTRAMLPLGRSAGNLLREVHVDDLAR
jgi:hypothetical protein